MAARLTVQPGRIRKAWSVGLRGRTEHIVFGISAGKVRYEYWLDASDCLSNIRIIDVIVRRSPDNDMVLPARDPAADGLSQQQIAIILHAFGANRDPIKAGYRSHFVTRADDTQLVALVGQGLMIMRSPHDLFGGDACFLLTQRGREVALSLTPLYAHG